MRKAVYIVLWGFLAGCTSLAYGQDPPQSMHGAMAIDLDCAACHRTNAWKPLRAPLSFDHSQQTRFPLTGSHALTTCMNCHVEMRFDTPKVEANDCASCHVDVHQGEFQSGCIDCHNTTSFHQVEGLEAHNRTRFPLTGAHAQISCESCHSSDEGGAFSLLDTECQACHESDYDIAHSASGFPTTCETCHTTLAWAATPSFDHTAASGGFALLGAHEPLDCASCHREPSFQPIFSATSQDDCLSCHQADYDAQHTGTGFSTECADCHGIDTWEGAFFDHAEVADGFDLVGAHRALECAACHQPPPSFEPLFTPTNQEDCLSCHQSDYQQEHAEPGFPTTCLTCHNTTDWEGTVFDHASVANGFALLGAHEPLECSTCHAPPPGFEPLFSPVGQDDCLTCHQQEYQDEHADSGFPTQCLACHTTDTWDDAVFSHGIVANGFDLVGAHEPLECSACHGPPPGFEPLLSPVGQDDCLTCHQQDYQDEHAGTGFPTECLACHNTDTWGDAVFDHASVANGFALVGAHTEADCSACHQPPPDFTPIFAPSDEDDCLTCHQPDYQSAHAGSGFPTTCQTCHTAEGWTEASFEHASTANGFALLGAHEQLPCLACHAPPPDFTPLFSPTDDSDCLSCHQQDYEQEHAGTGFPTQCLACHTTDTWGNANFEHGSVANGFRLLGAHEALECTACHALPPDFSPVFTPADDNDCFTCHEQDYQGEHAGTGFPTTCLDCHNTNDWDDADFNHSATSGGFRLLGAHETLSCSACHGPPPDLTPTFNPAGDDDCYTCHQDDYQQEHGGSGFPMTCLTCHNTNDWGDVDLDHDNAFFPIFSGKHREAWNTCMDCHTDSSDFSVFSCLTCHEHNQNKMDDKHKEENGYVYESSACLSCHPTGDD